MTRNTIITISGIIIVYNILYTYYNYATSNYYIIAGYNVRRGTAVHYIIIIAQYTINGGQIMARKWSQILNNELGCP